MRRKDREQSAAFARTVLDTCQYATLCTVNPDGTPYGVAISPVAVGDVVYFHCAMQGQKLDNIAHCAQVCLFCVSSARTLPEIYSTAYASALITGPASAVDNDDERIMALRALCEKYAPNDLDKFDAAIARSLHRTAVYKIKIEHISGKQKQDPQSPAA